MLEEHIVQEPEWLRRLVNEVVLKAVTPLGFIGPLGYRWWEPSQPGNQYSGWQVAVFPTANEVCGPTAKDGCLSVSGFSLNVGAILASMTQVKTVAWCSPARYNGDLDGPELNVQGQYAGNDVWLRIFHLPPPDEPCYSRVDPTGRRVQETG